MKGTFRISMNRDRGVPPWRVFCVSGEETFNVDAVIIAVESRTVTQGDSTGNVTGFIECEGELVLDLPHLEAAII